MIVYLVLMLFTVGAEPQNIKVPMDNLEHCFEEATAFLASDEAKAAAGAGAACVIKNAPKTPA